MPELMHPHHTEVIFERLEKAQISESRIAIDNAIQAAVENQTSLDGVRPNLDNAQAWDEIEYLVIDRLGHDADEVFQW